MTTVFASVAMDQRKHTLLLRLRPPTGPDGKPVHSKRNKHGSVGVIRVRLDMSER